MKHAEENFEELTAEATATWLRFGKWERVYFPKLVGLEVQAVRLGYCRMLLPFRPELEQPMGIVHGGAIATLIDAVVVPAIGSAYGPEVGYTTLDMHIQYLAAMSKEDAVAEGVVLKRGRSVVFCEANVFGLSSGKHLARGSLTYNVSTGRSAQ
ncbi:MAG: hypothetical protein RLZ19_776 [Actinomycetota bacterium]